MAVKKRERGVIISFEGGEGAGKTGQIDKLRAYFKQNKITYVFIREPGGTIAGNQIRRILKSKKDNLVSRAELLLFMAARALVTDLKIIPGLEKGRVVICDRFIDSSVAYQSYGRGIKRSIVDFLNNFATKGIKPDLTIFLDVDPEAGLHRAWDSRNGKSDRIEDSDISFHEKLHQGYLDIAKSEPNRVKIIDTNDPVDWDYVHQQIVEMVQLLLADDSEGGCQKC